MFYILFFSAKLKFSNFRVLMNNAITRLSARDFEGYDLELMQVSHRKTFGELCFDDILFCSVRLDTWTITYWK